jgi:heme exporter protein CcmD
MDLQKFFAMGGYAGFVWSAYGLTALVLVWNTWSAHRSETEARTSAQRRTELSRETRS